MYLSHATSMTPLCVQLDGGIVRTNVVTESLLTLVKQDLRNIYRAVIWLFRGWAVFKDEIAQRTQLDPRALPYNKELLEWLGTERQRGRPIWLCTAANERVAGQIAEHLRLFDGVIASNSRLNLDGPGRARRLVEAFGYRCFDYCGSGATDIPAWQCAHAAVTVRSSRGIEERASACVPLLQSFPRPVPRWRATWRALRPHQWAKNVLVFVPMLAAHRVTDIPTEIGTWLAFAAFCLVASSVYLLNDMLDLDSDRAHARKSLRPFASGDLPILTGLWLIPALLLVAAGIAAFLPGAFALALAAYFLMTLAYSLRLKRVPLLDTSALAALYTVRIIAGGLAVDVPVSLWLLLFSIFIFLSLAFVKRYAEFDAVQRAKKLTAVGRSYHVHDLPLLESLGTAAGYMSVVVLALYINSPAAGPMYRHPRYIWVLCILLTYWIGRLWMKTHRGEMHDDPVLFALHDRVSLGIGIACALVVGLAM
jgi:4-hydroxybenzoate polyprenyltransferase/phosphoserine phosphatase